MPRRLNFTGRRKITREDISIRITETSDGIRFVAELQLTDYGFPPESRVFVEAYRSLSALWKRFDFGRASLVESPADTSLREFGHPEGILFRVKVSAEGEHRGRLLGEADGIRPRLPDDEKRPSASLILVDKGPLKGEPWQVRFADNESALPVLVINDRIEDWNSRVRDPMFRSLVLPDVMRQILTRILVIDADVGEDDPEEASEAGWRQKWLRFAESVSTIGKFPKPLATNESLDERDDLTAWIDDAVGEFGQRSGLLDSLVSRWGAEANS